MASTNPAAPTLRRSSRSTRGSVKPVVDLTKPYNDADDVDKDIDKDEDEEEEVQIIESSDEEYKESVTKTKRATRKTKAKEENVKVDKNVNVPKQRKRNVKQVEPDLKPAVKSSRKSTKAAPSLKQEVQQEQEVNESNEDLDDIYYQLNEKEMKEVNKAFDMNCSSDGEELLNGEDLKAAIRSLGFEPRADEIQKLMKRFIKKGNKVNRDNFHKIMASKMSSTPNANDKSQNDEISKVFNLLDLDKTGMITLENLRAISKELNEEITEEELLEMIEEADLDGDLQINKEEFYNIMKKTSLY